MDLSNFDIVTARRLAASDTLLNYVANSPTHLKMHKSDAKTRLFLGGKRSGKTTWGAIECCWAALGIHPYLDYPPPPLKIRVCGVSMIAGVKGILLPMFKQWLPPHVIKRWWAEESILELYNGTLIDFKSYEMDEDKFEGVARDLIWMDEEPPKFIYASNFMRSIQEGTDGKIILTCTPMHGLNWIYDELYDNPEAIPPAVETAIVSIYDNPHITSKAIDAIKRDPALRDSLDSVLYGRFVPKSGLIYKEFGDKNILPPVAHPDKDWLLTLGLDLHDRNPHGVVFMGLNKDGAWTVYDEIYEHCIIADLVKKIKAKMGDRFPAPINIIDTSSNTPQSISGMTEAQELSMRYGIYTIEAHKDIQSGILRVSSFIKPIEGKPKLYITENCIHTLREIKHYVWDEFIRRKDKHNPKEKPLKKDDHLLDAVRYVCMADVKYRPPGWKFERTVPKNISRVSGYY